MSKIFYEIQFPTDIAYGATGGPEFFTDVVTSSSGFEQRNINWLQPRGRYNLAPAIKTREQLEYILSLFRLCQGKAIGFRFKDWSDYQIKRQQIAVGDGEMSEFQLSKSYEYLGMKTMRKIIKPVEMVIYCDGKQAHPQIDKSSGVIKFAQAPQQGEIIEAEGEFDVPVRFDIDHLVTSLESYAVYSYHDIPLIEIKL